MKKSLRKFLAVIIVLSMVFTSHAFVTFAENFENVSNEMELEKEKDESFDVESEVENDEESEAETLPTIETNLDDEASDDPKMSGEGNELVGASSASPEDETSEENVGASSTSPEEIVEPEAEEPEEDESDYPEEPEEDETEVTVEASEVVVGASSTSPDDETETVDDSDTLDRLNEDLVGINSTSAEDVTEGTEVVEESIEPTEDLGDVGPLFGAQVLQSIDIQYVPRDYDIGDHYNPSGLVVTPTYQEAGVAGLGDRGTPVSYDDHPECFSFSPDYVTSLTFTTRGHVNMNIIFTDAEGRSKSSGNTLTIGTITNIAITTSPKTNYRVGENFDPTGLVVTATWKNGETEEVSYATKPSNFMALGDTTNLQESNTYVEYLVKVMEGIERPVQIPITVTDKSVTSFTIGTQPTKRTYTVGETFDPAGLVANVTYDDGSNGTLSYASDASKFSFDPSLTTALTTSHTQVKVTIGSAHQNIPITVNKAIDSISVLSHNTNTITADGGATFLPAISQGETFDLNGMVLKVTYNDGSTSTVTYNSTTASQFTISDNGAGNPSTITIGYGGKQTTYDYYVQSNSDFYIYINDPASNKKVGFTYIQISAGMIEYIYDNLAGSNATGFYVINATGLKDAWNKYNKNAAPTMTKEQARAAADAFNNPLSQDIYWGITYGSTNPGGNNNSGSDSGSSDEGASDPAHGPMGDLTKDPEYINIVNHEALNTENNIPQDSLLKDDNLIVALESYPENSSTPQTNARDKDGNTGYGKWLNVPGTTIWYFNTGSFSNGNSGLLRNGWYNLGWRGVDEWYHFDENGVMDIGWYEEDGKTYYLLYDFSNHWYGKVVTGTQVINGQVYNFDSNGVLII